MRSKTKTKGKVIRLAAHRKKGRALAVVQRPPANILELLARASMDPRVDPEKMRALFDMRARELFCAALDAAQQEIYRNPVVKTSVNPSTKSFYAKLEAISDVIDPIIHKHGLAISFTGADSKLEKHYRFKALLYHKGGYINDDLFIDFPADDVGPKGNPNKTPLHAVASASTYAKRYLKTMIFDVPLIGVDDDGNLGRTPITEEQVKKLTEKMREAKVDEAKFLAWLGVSNLAELPQAKLGKAFMGIEQKLEQSPTP